MMDELFNSLHQYAVQQRFSGVYSYVLPDEYESQAAFGYRDRELRLENDLDTRFGVASGTKSFTAIGVAQLVEKRLLKLDASVHSIVGDVVHPLRPDVTVEHLLSHTSGIGDYYDESLIVNKDDYQLEAAMDTLLSPSDYAELIQKSLQNKVPASDFSYSNSGYILLALIIENVTGTPFHEYIESAVFEEAGMSRSGFFMFDNLPENTAHGYISEMQTNKGKLPIRGCGDGGAYSTLEDIATFWSALRSGKLVEKETLQGYWRPAHPVGGRYYGKGFYYEPNHDIIQLEGADAGVSFQSGYNATTGAQYTVISNTSDGAWLLTKKLRELL